MKLEIEFPTPKFSSGGVVYDRVSNDWFHVTGQGSRKFCIEPCAKCSAPVLTNPNHAYPVHCTDCSVQRTREELTK